MEAKVWRVRPLGEFWELYNGESCFGHLFESEASAAFMAGAMNERDALLSAFVPFKDGDSWCVLLGENLQEGVAGFGDTPDAARAALVAALVVELVARKEGK